jgi:hypothetical protein
VTGVENASAIDSGTFHTCALLANGDVFCWGNNSSGQIGNGAFSTDVATPVKALLPEAVVQITAGGTTTCARTAGGKVYCWGDNGSGQLGNGTTTASLSPVAVPGLTGIASVTAWGSHTCARYTTGAFRCWGLNFRGQVGVATTTNVLSPANPGGTASVVSAGGRHTCANTSSLKCWGYNDHGELGTDTAWLFPVAAPVFNLF